MQESGMHEEGISWKQDSKGSEVSAKQRQSWYLLTLKSPEPT